MPSRGEQNITYNPELAALAEGKEVFEAGYIDPYAQEMGYQAKMPVQEPEPPSVAQEIDPYLDKLKEVDEGLASAEKNMAATIDKQKKRAAKDDAEWDSTLKKRAKLEKELEKPKAPAVKKEPLVVPKQEIKSDKKVWSVDYQEDLGSYIQNLLNAQLPLPRHLYIKDIDQEIDLLGRIKDEEGNLLAERWFADDELLQSDVYQKQFENAIAPVTEEEEAAAKETGDGDRIQQLLKEFKETQSKLEQKLKEAKGK
jgi:hypothetical protein